MAGEIHYQAAQLGQASPGGRLDPPLLMGLDEVTQICPVPLPVWLSDSGGKGIQVCAVAHGEAQLASRWQDHGKQVVLDTCSVKILLPGITDTKALDAASKICGQAAWREHGQKHASRHDVITPGMIRQLPAGFGLVIRGGLAPVIARLPRAWNDPAYKRARRAGQAIAELTPAPPAGLPAIPSLEVRPWRRRAAARPVPGRHHVPVEHPVTGHPEHRRCDDRGPAAARRPRRPARPARRTRGRPPPAGHRAAGRARGTARQPRPARPATLILPTGTGTATGQLPAPRWWQLDGQDREDALDRLRGWVAQVYRPGYGQLAATLGPCWEQHPLCLYGLDLLAELWSLLYLQPGRTPAVVSAQAEFQARIVPAIAEQLMIETTRCGHSAARPARPGGRLP